MIQLIVAVVALSVAFAGGWTVNQWRHDAGKAAEIAAQAKADAAAETRLNEAVARVDDRLSKLRVVQKTFYNEVKHETTNTVYSDPNCNLPESGRLLRNRAIEAANRAGEPGGGMPANPPRGKADVAGGSVRSGQ